MVPKLKGSSESGVSKYRQLFPEVWLSTGGERECGEVVVVGVGGAWFKVEGRSIFKCFFDLN